MANFPTYEPARRCTGTVTAGAAALMAWSVNDFGRGARNWGIYNCRTVRGGPSTSLHAEGRAVDVGFSGFRNPAGTALVNALLPHVGKLGIQQIIWARRIWSRKHPNGAYYSGAAPHNDHVHIELTWAAARQLSVATIRAAVRGVASPVVVAPKPKPQPIVIAPPPKPRRRPVFLIQAAGGSAIWITDLQDRTLVPNSTILKAHQSMLEQGGYDSKVRVVIPQYLDAIPVRR